jgi:putative intracellular protease/amidase
MLLIEEGHTMQTPIISRLVFEGNGKTHLVTLTNPTTLDRLAELLARATKRAPVISVPAGSNLARVTL